MIWSNSYFDTSVLKSSKSNVTSARYWKVTEKWEEKIPSFESLKAVRSWKKKKRIESHLYCNFIGLV